MQALSKAKLRLFRSLRAKKKRSEAGLFIAEGEKLTKEALKSSFFVQAVVIREEGVERFKAVIERFGEECFTATKEQFAEISSLENPEGILAVLSLPEIPRLTHLPPGPGLILGGIQDPGNAGTILRIAAWFGLKHVLYTPGTVDLFNPKTLRASMGAIFQVSTAMIVAEEGLLERYAPQIWIADMEGMALSEAKFGAKDYILLGNEAQGLDPAFGWVPGIRKVHIPGKGLAESLNVSVAAGILVYEMVKKRGIKD